MKKIQLILLLFFAFSTNANAELLLFGGYGHDNFLGCYDCSKYDSDSICNKSIEEISTDPARVEQISTKKLKDRITKKNGSEHGRGEHITSKKMNDGAYTTAEAANSQRKRVFNSRLSGLRTVMSENMFGIWKRRFPVLKNLRADFNLSQKIIVATAILFNYGQVIDDEPPEEDDDDDDDRDDSSSAYQVIDEDRGTVRIRGQVQRDRLCNNMRM